MEGSYKGELCYAEIKEFHFAHVSGSQFEMPIRPLRGGVSEKEHVRMVRAGDVIL